DRAVEQPRQFQVADIRGRTGDEPRVFFAPNAGANIAGVHHVTFLSNRSEAEPTGRLCCREVYYAPRLRILRAPTPVARASRLFIIAHAPPAPDAQNLTRHT